MEKRIFLVLVCFLTVFTSCNSIKPQELNTLSHQNLDDRISFVAPDSNFNVRDKRDAAEPQGSGPPLTSSSSSSSINQSQQLLGVNGTGQRKDYASTTPEPMMAANISVTKLLGGAVSSEIPVEDFDVDTIDQTETETNSTLFGHNITKFQEDYHVYYNSSIYQDKAIADRYWQDVTKNLTISNLLSRSHRRAMTIQLSFDFPFYGHPVRNVTVATGGFLYTGDHVHSWLAATQYIAPLMANFDTSLSNDSYVKYSDNGTAFTVLWENVKLQDKDEGTFTFSATLYSTGDIAFVYYNIPISIMAIQDDKHPVKVGLSDAYIIDKTIFFARRKTIYEYHRVSFTYESVQNSTIIELKAQTSCLDFTDCQSCASAELFTKCRWCPVINRCSTGTDRRRQEWMHKSCDSLKIEDPQQCPALGEKGNNYNSTSDAYLEAEEEKYNATDLTQDSKKLSIPASGTSRINDRKLKLNDEDQLSLVQRNQQQNSIDNGMNTWLGFFIPIALVMTIVGWIFYAYRNPHTKSGQLLIQYRPSQWSWRRGEARYTAATIHM